MKLAEDTARAARSAGPHAAFGFLLAGGAAIAIQDGDAVVLECFGPDGKQRWLRRLECAPRPIDFTDVDDFLAGLQTEDRVRIASAQSDTLALVRRGFLRLGDDPPDLDDVSLPEGRRADDFPGDTTEAIARQLIDADVVALGEDPGRWNRGVFWRAAIGDAEFFVSVTQQRSGSRHQVLAALGVGDAPLAIALPPFATSARFLALGDRLVLQPTRGRMSAWNLALEPVEPPRGPGSLIGGSQDGRTLWLDSNSLVIVDA